MAGAPFLVPALTMAAMAGQVGCLQLLLDKGADPDICATNPDSQGLTRASTVMLCVRYDKLDALQMLIDYQADLE